MSLYKIKLSLGGASQPEMMERLKSAGASVIQTGDGLCVRGDFADEAQVRELAGEAVDVETLKEEELLRRDDIAPDLRAFAEQR